ncbi:hypothetical protein B0T20DRAFT_452722 [Sordaria brevicollis]|uniref:Protein kinase domain-containing protein n=1 Tax=Sordaria brevicollis TaxID=83679 RepID=A0AAE0PFT7_SORBR|nr:hypothetical protein B0T20DRAFT_452722 [Sordaria brevicollis]
MSSQKLNTQAFVHTWRYPPILKPATQGVNSSLTIQSKDIPSTPTEAHAYVKYHGRSFQIFPSSKTKLQDYFVPGDVIFALSRKEIIDHLIKEPSLRDTIYEKAPRLFVMCLFLFTDYENMLQKLLNYDMNDRGLPIMPEDLDLQDDDWVLGERLINTLIPNQSRFMVDGSWLGPEEDEDQISVLTGQALPLWVTRNSDSVYRREWIGEETRVRVHEYHDILRKADQKGLYALRVIKCGPPFPTSTSSSTYIVHSAITRSNTLLRALRNAPYPHITRPYKVFFYDNILYTILPVAICSLDYLKSNRSLEKITSTNSLREIMGQVAYLASALAVIHNIPSKSENDNSMEVTDVPRKTTKRGFHLDIQPRNILVFGHANRLHLTWTGFECSAVREVPETSDSSEVAEPIAAYRLFSTDMDRSAHELYRKYLKTSDKMYFPPESEDLSTPVTQAYDMWSMGVLMLDMLIWSLYQGQNLGMDDMFEEMGTQPSNIDSKSSKQTKTTTDPSDERLYEPVPPDPDADTAMDTTDDTNSKAPQHTNENKPTLPTNADADVDMDTDDTHHKPSSQTLSTHTLESLGRTIPKYRVKPTVLQRIAHILDTFVDSPRINQWCNCILSLLEPEPHARTMTAGDLAKMLQPDTKVNGDGDGDEDRDRDRGEDGFGEDAIEKKVLSRWFHERRKRFGKDEIRLIRPLGEGGRRGRGY